jgi:hypothetical protein
VKEQIKPLIFKLLIIDSILIGLGLVASSLWLGMNHFPGILIAIVITTVNAVAAVILAGKGLNGTMNDFMLRAMGGMGVRLAAMLIVIFLLLGFTNIPEFSFIISLFISYICKSVLEIIFILKLRNQSQLLGK